MSVWYELEIVNRSNNSFYMDVNHRLDENAGFDLHCSENMFVDKSPVLLPFGISARLIRVESTETTDLTSDSHFWIVPRSSIYKTGLMMANSVGVIDKSYRGELKAPVVSLTGDTKVLCGDRLFQIVAPDMGWIRHVRVVNDLPNTVRGQNGFGSSGQ
jgi:dUTPase